MQEENEVNAKHTPYANRGYVNTIEKPMNACVDWFEVTFRHEFNFEKIIALLGMNLDDFTVRDYGKHYYRESAVNGKIMILWNGSAENMGVHVEMSGQGCRQYELIRGESFTWSEFFRELLPYDIKVSRLDLALDDYSGILNIRRMYNLAKKGCLLVPRVNVAKYIETIDLKTGETLGQTFYIGKANWIVRFYDKLQERLGKGLECEHSFWNRYEIEMRNDLATNVFKYLCSEGSEVGYFVKSFLKTKIDYKVKHKTDSNRSRWKTQPFWEKFLNDVEEIEFIKKEVPYTVEKSFNWVDKQVLGTYAMLDIAIGDSELLNQYARAVGRQKMDRQKENAIREFKNNEQLQKSLREYMYQVVDADHKERNKGISKVLVSRDTKYLNADKKAFAAANNKDFYA